MKKKSWKSRFLTWWPWPLTYDLHHRSHPRYDQGQSLNQLLWSYDTRFSCESTNRQTDRQTDRHTDGTVFITSTANAGGNLKNQCLPHIQQSMTQVLDPPSPLWQRFPFILDIELWTQSLMLHKPTRMHYAVPRLCFSKKHMFNYYFSQKLATVAISFAWQTEHVYSELSPLLD